MATTYPAWIFDGSPIDDPFGHGAKAIEFLRRLKHPASTAPKRAFQLYDWQERIVRRIYGPRHSDQRRIVETVFLLIPRGNRKTSLAAALALLHTIGPEKLPAGQVIFAACDREQAGIGFKEAANIVRADKRLIAATKINDAVNGAKKITYRAKDVTLQAISSDGAAQHGKTPTFILVDELHKWKGRELWEALKTSQVKRDNLMVIATTAGRGQENIAYERYEYARRVALGEIDDPTFLPILFEAEPGDDWRDEAVWHRVNPGLQHGFPILAKMRTAAKEAEHIASTRLDFQQFNLNVWMAASRDPLFDMANYDAGQIALDLDDPDLAELPCFLGVDVSRSGDLTAICAAWRAKDGTIILHPWFFLPAEGLEEKARLENVPYPQWRDDRHLDVIEGRTIEPDAIAAKIIELCATYAVEQVAFDPSLAGPIMETLLDHGVNVVQQLQKPSHMHGPICDLERVVNGRRLKHAGHPILRHHLDSVVVRRATNATGLVTMHKGTRHTNHIDGAIAAAIAVSRAAMNDNTPSIFERDPAEYAALMNAAA